VLYSYCTSAADRYIRHVLYQGTLHQQQSSPKFSYQTYVTDISIGRTRTTGSAFPSAKSPPKERYRYCSNALAAIKTEGQGPAKRSRFGLRTGACTAVGNVDGLALDYDQRMPMHIGGMSRSSPCIQGPCFPISLIRATSLSTPYTRGLL